MRAKLGLADGHRLLGHTILKFVIEFGLVTMLSACCVVGTRYEDQPTKGWRDSTTGVFYNASKLPEFVDKVELQCYKDASRIYMNEWCEEAEATGNYKKRLYVPNTGFIVKALETYCIARSPIPKTSKERDGQIESCFDEPVEVQMKEYCDKRLPLPENLKGKSGGVKGCMAAQGYSYAEQENWSCQSNFFRLF